MASQKACFCKQNMWKCTTFVTGVNMSSLSTHQSIFTPIIFFRNMIFMTSFRISPTIRISPITLTGLNHLVNDHWDDWKIIVRIIKCNDGCRLYKVGVCFVGVYRMQGVSLPLDGLGLSLSEIVCEHMKKSVCIWHTRRYCVCYECGVCFCLTEYKIKMYGTFYSSSNFLIAIACIFE